MCNYRRVLIGGIAALSILGPAAAAWSAAATSRYSGSVLAVNQTAGTMTVASMGPRLASGESKATPVTVQITPSTEFVRARRAADVAPSGWIGGFEEISLPAWEVKPGDWVAVAAEGTGGGTKATRVTVVTLDAR